MVILLFGPPGSGKGTQSGYITRRLNIPAISTGEMLRAGVEAGTQAGETRQQVETGILVGDDLVNNMVEARLEQSDCNDGFLLDGYPRTIPQAQFLGKLLDRRRLPAPMVIHLDVPRNILLERVTSRRQCASCGKIYNLLSQAPKADARCDVDGAALTRRADDDEEVIGARLRAYEEMTGPLIDYYKNRNYYWIDGNRDPKAISEEIEALLERRHAKTGSQAGPPR